MSSAVSAPCPMDVASDLTWPEFPRSGDEASMDVIHERDTHRHQPWMAE